MTHLAEKNSRPEAKITAIMNIFYIIMKTF